MRSKLWLILGVVLVSAGILFSATQTWVILGLTEGSAAFGWLEATGQQLNASLSPIALAGLASALALSIAAPVLRRILGAVIALLGAGVVAIAATAMSDPQGAAAGRLAEATGITGSGQEQLIASSTISVYPALSVGLGAALLLCGVLVLVLGGRWGTAGRRYASREQREAADARSDAPDRFDDWDRLSEGGDPTASDESS